MCAANYGKGMTAKYRKKKSKGLRRRRNEKDKAHAQEPQAWIAMMWHMGLRPPWHWRLDPANSSERAHVMEMVPTSQYPQRTLFCGDAGFVGYPLWACLLGTRLVDSGHGCGGTVRVEGAIDAEIFEVKRPALRS
ncbi:MAG TPA: hypothetical protein VG097_02575 [Gemmata sp.]|nr:hypothetical protein [Gemmata sp.]